MNPKTALLIRIALIGLLILAGIGAVAHAIRHEANANAPFKTTMTKFRGGNEDVPIYDVKIDITATRHSRIVGIIIDKPGAFTGTEKELLARAAIRFVWAGHLLTPVGSVTPDGMLELKLPEPYFLEPGDVTTLGFLAAVSCNEELAAKNAKVTFDLMGIIIRDDKNRLVKTDPRWFPAFITLSCQTSI